MKYFVKKLMLPAKTLLVAMVFLSLTSIIIGGLLSFNQVFTLQQTDQSIQRQALNSLQNAFVYLRNSPLGNEEIQLFSEKVSTVEIEKKSWGVYQIGLAKVPISDSFGADTLLRVGLFGAEKSMHNAATRLKLTPTQSLLHLGGTAFIDGDSQLPNAEVKEANLPGVVRKGPLEDRLVGEVTTSTVQSLLGPDSFVEGILHLQKQAGSLFQERNNYSSSFLEESLKLESSDTIVISKAVKGNIVVHSKKHIYVQASAELDLVILMAPSIHFASEFQGRVQCFASEEIVLEEGVELAFPSCLGLLPFSQAPIRNGINLGNDCHVNGLLFAQRKIGQLPNRLINIPISASVSGQVWSNTLVKFQGQINGLLSADKLELNHGGATYINHLIDGQLFPYKPNYVDAFFENTNQWKSKLIENVF